MELREVLERSRLTVSYLEDSGDSLDNEDDEMIKVILLNYSFSRQIP